MGDSRPDNGGGGGLPDLPPEWGTIVIPDDASELDAERRLVRRELRRQALRRWLRALLRLHPIPLRQARAGRMDPSRTDESSGALALAIMTVAILTTLISLFVVTWGRRDPGPQPVITAEADTATEPAGIADVVLRDEAGGPVRLGNLLPAIVLLIDDCRCPGLVLDVAVSTPTGVRVLAVAASAPSIPDRPENIASLADPTGMLRERYGGAVTPAGASALVVSQDGTVVATVTGVTKVDDLPPIDVEQLR